MSDLPSPKEAFVRFFQDLWKQLSKRSDIDFDKPMTEEEKRLGMAKASEVLQNTMFSTAGITKIEGIRKMLEGAAMPAIKAGASGELPSLRAGMNRAMKVMKEALGIPEETYGKLSKMEVVDDIKRLPGAHAAYIPSDDAIKLVKGKIRPGTLTHEFTHANQYNPMDIGQAIETDPLFALREKLNNAVDLAGMSKEARYLRDPLEIHAREMGKNWRLNKDFDWLFEATMPDAIAKSEKAIQGISELLSRRVK